MLQLTELSINNNKQLNLGKVIGFFPAAIYIYLNCCHIGGKTSLCHVHAMKK